MAGPAPCWVVVEEFFVLSVGEPCSVIHVVQAMGAIGGGGQSVTMANTTFPNGTSIPLQLNRGRIVVGFPAGPLRMRASVAGLTRHSVMSQTVAKQRVGIFGESLIDGNPEYRIPWRACVGLFEPDGTQVIHRVSRVARLAFWLIDPRLS